MTTDKKQVVLLAAGIGLVVIGCKIWAKLREADLSGQVVLITGGSRGLGLALAREFASHGCRLALCARDVVELARAENELATHGADVLTVVCDLRDRGQVDQMVGQVTEHFGQIDILVNNAGVIEVGPVVNQNVEDFDDAMQTDFWGVLYPTLAVLPQMRGRRNGRIVNVTSIGGKVSVPHLLPYSCAKFAAQGLSEGLRAELARDGIVVTTIAPGLLRTGSFLNALFKGHQAGEYAWFSVGDNIPGLSMAAEGAAQQIVQAARRGEAERVLGVPAKLAAKFHGLFPGLTADLSGLVNRTQPSADESARGNQTQLGSEVREEYPSAMRDRLTGIGFAAAERLNEQ
jgi:NAD(P)-dependent dehydrogenase (short-subunit alcohol dehydrogenase family)